MEKIFDITYRTGDWSVRIEYTVNGEYAGLSFYIENAINEGFSVTKAFEGSVSEDEAFIMAQRILRDIGEDFQSMVKKVISDMKHDQAHNRKYLFGKKEVEG